MVDDRRPEGEEQQQEAAADAGETTDWSSRSNLWQVPTIAASVVLIAAGLYVAARRAPDNDFAAALDQVDELIATGQYDAAATRLNEVIEPNLDLASPAERARFEATVADWIALSQRAEGLDLDANNRRIDEHYTRAADLGLDLAPERLERWATAEIARGDLESARTRLDELGRRADDGEVAARRSRNRVLRRFVEAGLRRPDADFDSLMQMLEAYRAERDLAPADELWAIGRQAELRLEAGRAEAAIRHLLVDMRRFEPRLDAEAGVHFGELYTLLGRAYFAQGDLRYARFHVDQALQLLGETAASRGEALVLLGRLAVADDRWHDAFEHFDRVVREFATTEALAPALLGRAEVHGILGDDARSLADYRRLREVLARQGPRRDLAPRDAARSLVDRHDAALTTNRLKAALDYVLLAESFFEAGHVPADVLFRVASTSRQIADNLLAGAGAGDVPPEVRYEANEHYARAGDYFVRHARAVAGRPGADGAWADSLWLAADSYDLGGRHDEAVRHFEEYVAGRSEADPRRPEAVFRLAQAHHAALEYEQAADAYRRVLDGHPRSHVASRCHVPLARCLLALGRRPEAEQQMLEVLSGRHHLKPDAVDYRDALIELGALYYEEGDFARAIERLDEAARRYPDDPRAGEIRFRLADSYRRRATDFEQELSAAGAAPPRRHELSQRRREYLETAAGLFASICGPADGGAVEPSMLRYACLYRADCVFELGRYEAAAGLYDDVAVRFPRHHSSMTALIQIVNCYFNLGDAERARTAHRRALARLEELPDEAFQAPDALLDRQAWERWLRNMPVGSTGDLTAASS